MQPRTAASATSRTNNIGQHDSEAATGDLGNSLSLDGGAGGSPPQTEQLLSEVLADVLEVEQVPVTSHFFDDLGADSLVMAHFCARLRKRDDLPSVSIKEVYQHPTIGSLAAAITTTDPEPTADPASASPSASTWAPTRQSIAPATPVRRWQYFLCGAAQVATLFDFAVLSAFIVAWGYDWISAASGVTDTYVRSALYSGAVFVGWSMLPIVVKWVLLGRSKPQQFRVWSLAYFRFWFIRLVVQSSPLVAFAGTPIHLFYLRALGARIGRRVVIATGRVPVYADLLTVGDNTIIRKDTSFSCYRAHAGFIQTGPVTIGRDAFVGEGTVLDIHTTLGDGAQIGHSSALYPGQSVPDGEHRVGTPALQRTEVDYRAVAPTGRPALRRMVYSVLQLLVLFTVSLPLAVSVVTALAEWRITPDALLGVGSSPPSTWAFYGEALVFSVVLFSVLTVARLVFVFTVPRLLKPFVKPDKVYPLYGLRYFAHSAITRLTNVTFFTNLFGDSSYIVHYLHCLGYDVSFDEQTGANFGLNVKHDNPYQVSIGAGTMVADGLSIVNADYSNTSFRVSPVTIGSHSFLGNNIAYPSQGKTGENCLHGSKVMVPVEGEVREGVGFLGSPSFEIPRLVFRDRKFDDLKSGDERGRRLAAKNRHNLATMAWFLLSRLVGLLGAVLLAFAAADFYLRFGVATVVAVSVITLLYGTLYYIMVERASTGFKPLRPLYVSMYDRESWRIERYWKLSWQPALFNGTPFKNLIWRLMGVRMGKRVFDDGCLMIEKTMITVGDDCVLNAGSVIQPHSQEDGTFKSDYITVGAGCTLGVGALVHYGVTMGDGATLAANAFLMKGAEVPPHTHWGENPAREFEDDRPAEPAETDPVPAQLAARGLVTTNGGQTL